MSVVWVKEWLDKNKGRLYLNQNSSLPAKALRQSISEFNTTKTYENAVEVQRHKRQMQDYRKVTFQVVKGN